VTVKVAVFVTAPNFALIVTLVVDVTDFVVIVKVTEFMPGGTVTVPGSVAVEELLCNVTTVPPDPACPVKVIVPVEELPPLTDVGFKLKVESTASVIVNVAVGDFPLRLAVMTDVVDELTPVVVTVNVALDCPAGTVTDGGTLAGELLLVNATETPPDAAGPFKVTVPVELDPPTTEVGFKVTLMGATGRMVR